MSFALERRRGPVAAMLDGDLAAEPTIHVVELTRPAVVLGSAQDPRIVDAARCAARGIDLARRRSGGGAVHLVPGAHVWIDVSLPDGSDWASRPLEGVFEAVGDRFEAALRSLGLAVDRWRGRPDRDPVSRAVCFAGHGHGEMDVAGAKVVGLSQRRRRVGVTVQCLCLCRWDHGELLELVPDLPGGAASRLPPAGSLGVGPEALLDAVLAHLG